MSKCRPGVEQFKERNRIHTCTRDLLLHNSKVDLDLVGGTLARAATKVDESSAKKSRNDERMLQEFLTGSTTCLTC
jgi:hypothetical protein